MFATIRPRVLGSISGLMLAGGASLVTGLSSASAADLAPFACSDAGGGAPDAATVTSVRIAHHSGYDRLVIGFATASAVPQFQVQRQASSHFVRDASGQPVALGGSAGLKVVLRNSDLSSGLPADSRPALPEIREVANIGNFERVVSYGVGLKDQACIRVLTLTGPSRLVIDVETPPDAAASTSAASAGTVPSVSTDTTDLPAALATTGHPTPPSNSPNPQLLGALLGVLALTGGIAITGLLRFRRR